MSDSGATRAVEDFLKAVYTLGQDGERVSTSALSALLAVSAPSVTDMARRLADEGLLDYRRYRGVSLTPQGEGMALRIIRRHRLIELYLMRELGYALVDVHDEAEKLEHAVSPMFIDAIERKLGYPEYDPHGDPIPDADGVTPSRDLVPLTELAIGEPATVQRYASDQADLLAYLIGHGFGLGTEVRVTAHEPFDGSLSVVVASQATSIAHRAAAQVLVERHNTSHER
jgi:DtxR family transcriptional regulator, Mn-dependent transcriptional regulator